VPSVSSLPRPVGAPVSDDALLRERLLVETLPIAPPSGATEQPDAAVAAIIGGFDVVVPRAPEGHALYLRGRLGGGVVRVSPARDPAQPRFWCLLVEHRGAVGPGGQRLGAVLGPGGLTREEAHAALGELAADPAAWLGRSRHRRLRAWLRSEAGEPSAAAGGSD
jgi:hypothetical protein